MSGREAILNKERALTQFEWFRKTKHTLRLRCADHGLSTTGKKADLVARLFKFMHPTGSSVEAAPDDEGNTSDEEGDGIEKSVQPHSAQQSWLTPEGIREMIQRELASQMVSDRHPTSAPSRPAIDNAPLSPASFAVAAPTPAPFINPPLAAYHANQGLSNPFHYQPSKSLLPPVSERILNEIKSLQFVDFNSLLPNALYDPSISTNNLTFEVNQSSDGSQLLSLQPTKGQKRKINNSTSWLEAWNIYIRAMAHFHPTMIPELLSYQDFMCSLQRSYPAQSWLKYDTAFRLHIALDKSASWSSINDQAFNKFIRCAVVQNKIYCFKCSSDSHLANSCPQRSFRPQNEQSFNHRFQPYSSQGAKSCRFYNSSTTKCEQRNCRFPHKCSSCGGNHPAFKCLNFSQSI